MTKTVKTILIIVAILIIAAATCFVLNIQNPFSLNGWYKSEDVKEYDTYLWLYDDMYIIMRHSEQGVLPVDAGNFKKNDNDKTKEVEYLMESEAYDDISFVHKGRNIVVHIDTDIPQLKTIKLKKALTIPKELLTTNE